MTIEERVEQLETQVISLSETIISQQDTITTLLGHVGTLYEGLTDVEEQIGAYDKSDPSLNEKINNLVENSTEAFGHITNIFNIMKRNQLK